MNNPFFKDPCLAKNHLQNLNESSWEMGKGASYRSDPEKQKTKPWQAWICYYMHFITKDSGFELLLPLTI